MGVRLPTQGVALDRRKELTMSKLTKDLLKALKGELAKRCGKDSECEVCGGNGTTLSYHADCCAKTRAAIAIVEGKKP